MLLTYGICVFVVFSRIAAGYLPVCGIWFYIKARWSFFQGIMAKEGSRNSSDHSDGSDININISEKKSVPVTCNHRT